MAKKTKFEIAVIDRVKQMREKKGLTQDDIAEMLNTSRGFVGQVESPTSASKYNLNHLNKIAQAIGCSPKDFVPENVIGESPKVGRKQK